MNVICFSFGEIGTNCYIAFDEKTRQTALIDIADNVPQRYFEKIEALKLSIFFSRTRIMTTRSALKPLKSIFRMLKYVSAKLIMTRY